MAYCVSTDVVAEFKSLDIVSAGVPVTTAKVSEFISQADAIINAKVGLKYEVPVAAGATESLKILKQISTWLVANRVKEILRLETGDKKVELLATGNLEKKAFAMLDEIVKGTLKLSDATLATSADGVRSFAVDNDEEHTFKKGEDQW